MPEKIKVAMITSNLAMTGIGSVVVNYSKYMNKDKYEVTIIAGEPIASSYIDICLANNITIIKLPSRRLKPKDFYFSLWQVLKKHEYSICHVHGNSATSSIELFLAALNGVKVRIMHCHTSECQHKKMHQLLSPFFKHLYTAAFACSSLAGNWIFGEGKFKVLQNGFETERFKFNIDKRNMYRSQLGLAGKFVIGHVGQINYQKNTEFSIKLFETFFAENDSACLLLVGNGRDRETYEEYIKNSACRDKIILYGESNDIPGMLSAMDVFIFPSRVEGLGIAVIEAQINGLPCVISDVVPKEVQVSKNVNFLPIGEENMKKWFLEIMKFGSLNIEREKEYEANISKIEKFNICVCAKVLENEYELLLSKQR